MQTKLNGAEILSCTMQRKDQIRIFQHKLTSEPASLFREGKMRKPAKNILRNHLLQK